MLQHNGKEFDEMKIRILIVSIASVIGISGCAIVTHRDQPQSAIQFNYTLQNPQATGIVQVFDMDGNTVIQINDNEIRHTDIFDPKGGKLALKKVGPYVVLNGIHTSIRVVSNGGQSAVTRRDSVPILPATVPLNRPQPVVPIPATEVRPIQLAEIRPVHQPAPSIDDEEPYRQELVRIRKELEELKALLAIASKGADISGEAARPRSRTPDITVVRVNFKYNSASFEPPKEVRETLQNYAKHAQQIEVRGYTDSNVYSQPDLNVAKSRAAAARSYLVAQGVSEDRIVTSAQASGGFIADNSTADGRAKNRRVEIELALPEKYAAMIQSEKVAQRNLPRNDS
ncbi:OmpA family protein [Noviherbaspirillum malthae]|uniref:OmpA family protein n=1 Tax=Noviherbaspirillum malthae TaxID=1260987 RepID=UPI00188E5195|nr:OmpA family protein [Noviherbaspirillum malthae]